MDRDSAEAWGAEVYQREQAAVEADFAVFPQTPPGPGILAHEAKLCAIRREAEILKAQAELNKLRAELNTTPNYPNPQLPQTKIK